MATLNDIISEIRSSLAGFTLRQDRITYLTSAINTTDTAVPIGSSANLAKGIVEIDDELLWINNTKLFILIILVLPRLTGLV